MAVKKILILGNAKLYNPSSGVRKKELKDISKVIEDLHDTLMDFRKRYSAGRAIAAPQIDVFKRIIYMNINKPIVILNPKIEYIGDEKIEIWDDCMCFPGLKVKVLRHKHCKIYYKDLQWNDYEMELLDDLSELIQHECDHLDGILAVQRAVDNKSFKLDIKRTRKTKPLAADYPSSIKR